LPDAALVHDLLTNALNCVRGEAGLTVAQMLREAPDRLPQLEPAIESLVADEHPAVRVAAVEACLPVLNIDVGKAISWFVRACDSDERVIACRAGVYFFNCGMQSHREQLTPLVRSMVHSHFDDVAQQGAKEVAARWLFYGFLEEELAQCRQGTVQHRKGVAQIAALFVREPQYSAQCQEMLRELLEDEDREVRGKARHAFRDERILAVPDAEAFIHDFIESAAFRDDPSPLFFALKDFSGSLLPYADLILKVCGVFAGPLREASRDMSTGIAGDAHMLPPLLLRLYEQASNIEDKQIACECLDAWDILFEKRVGITRELAQAIEGQ